MSARFRFSLLVLCLIVGSAGLGTKGMRGQSREAFQAPFLGMVYDRDSDELRAILGVPGASVFSSPLNLPAGISDVHFSPNQSYSVVERQGGATMELVKFTGLIAGTYVDLPTDIVRPSVVTFSPTGTAVAIHSPLEGKTQIIDGLPNAPDLVRDIKSDALPSNVRYLALGEDGTLIAGTANGIYLVVDGQPPTLMGWAGDLCGLVVIPGIDSVLVAEREGGRISVIQNIRRSPTSRPLAAGLPDMQREVLLQVESGRAVVVSQGSKNVRVIDLNTGQIQNLTLVTASTTAERLGTSRSVLLSYKINEPGWLLDLSGLRGTIFFVPAGNSREN